MRGKLQRRVWVEVNLKSLRRNYLRIANAVKPAKVLCVLKANAYGLGVEPYAAALAAEKLGMLPEKIHINVSGNIVKNVKSVVVPNTGGLRGLPAAAAAGVIAGKPSRQLEVISEVNDQQRCEIKKYLQQASFIVTESQSGLIFDIEITVFCAGHSASCRIAGYHTNVVHLEKDGTVFLHSPAEAHAETHSTDRSVLNVADIVSFADEVAISDVQPILDRQIQYNIAIAKAGMEQNFGARVGQILMDAYGDTVFIRAKAMAAAGSDARMNGCSLPVVINSGSGNQGITASVPVVVYAKELGVSQSLLYRALVVSNLVTIHLKTGIGRLSAYCGAISAGCGAGAGVAYLFGGRQERIAHTIVNAVAINSGVICDGAKSSCAAKIASAVEAGLLGMQMAQRGSEFIGGDGIVIKGVENTIKNVGRLAREGMAQTDKEIIDIMINSIPCS